MQSLSLLYNVATEILMLSFSLYQVKSWHPAKILKELEFVSGASGLVSLNYIPLGLGSNDTSTRAPVKIVAL